ncbi:MAG: cupin domain-containing protein [Actinomycetota bacterium]|nr:cupin domain-containing protein [Actinomycetota bacterium]
MSFGPDGYMLGNDEGDSIWFFNTLTTVKAGGEDTHGAFTLMQYLLPPGFGPPPHIHHREDEAFYVLEGEFDVTCGKHSWRATPGSFILLPRGITHSFQTWETSAVKLLQVTSPAQFEHYAAEMGEAATSMTLPEPAAPDMAKVLAIGEKYEIEFVPGPPAPVSL